MKQKTEIGNRMLMVDQKSWDAKIAKLKESYTGRVLFRIDTWKKYDWVIFENESEILNLNRNSEVSGVYGVVK